MALLLSLFLLTISVSHAYFILDNNGTGYNNRSGAEKACKARNRDLASIHSLEDINKTVRTLWDYGIWFAWIGLQRSNPHVPPNASDWHWSDGTPFNFVKWFETTTVPVGNYPPGFDNRCGLFLFHPHAPLQLNGYIYHACNDAVAPVLCNGEPTKPIEHCCTSNVPSKVKYYRKCAAKKKENECVQAIDKDTNEPKCKWVNCESAGYCKFNGVDDIVRRAEKKICGKVDNENDCINLGFCLWQKGMPPLSTPDDEYIFDDIDDEEFMVENGYLHNFMLLNGDKNYYNNLLLLFILFGGIIFICYQICNKCISSSVLKNEYESII